MFSSIRRPLVAGIAIMHALLIAWMCSSWDRLRLVLFDFREMPSELSLTAPPDSLRSMGYVEDDVAPLSSFRDIALPIIRDARTDGERARRLGDYIYSL